MGLGSAYRDGFRWGLERGYDVLVEMDADLSHDPAVLPVLLRTIDDGADLVIGSRYVAGGVSADWSFARRAISRIGCRYAQLMLGLPTRDATSGYRAYRAAALRSVDLDTVRANGYGFQVEMAYRVPARSGGAIQEVPIEFRDRDRGHLEDVAAHRGRGVGPRHEVGRPRPSPGGCVGLQRVPEHRDHPSVALTGRRRTPEHARVLERDEPVDAGPHRTVRVHLGGAVQSE